MYSNSPKKRINEFFLSSKNEFVCSYFGRIQGYQKTFRNYLTFSIYNFQFNFLPPFWSMGNVFWLLKDLHLKPCFHPPLLVQWIKVDQTCLRWILLMSPCMKGTEACHLKGKKIMVKEWYSHCLDLDLND